MKLSIHLLPLAALALGAALTGCSDSDDWTPGARDTETGTVAYFGPQAKYNYVFGSDADAADMAFDVTVRRVLTDAAVSLPLTVETEVEGFVCDPTVDFAAGEEEATFHVNCSGIPAGTVHDITISLPADQTDVYGPGVNQLSLTAIISDWQLLADPVTYYYFDSNNMPLFDNTKGKLYHLKGTLMFKLTDFFGSGLEIPFSANTQSETAFIPTANALKYIDVWGYDDYDCWYLYDEAQSLYPVWSPGNVEGAPSINYALFYGKTYSTVTMIYNSTTLYGYAGFSTEFTLSNGNVVWSYPQLDFYMNYNPFTAK